MESETLLDAPAQPDPAPAPVETGAQARAVIVGAGPSGLAIAACLKRLNVPFELLERHAAGGASWRNHYDRLHLHTVKEHSALPFLPFPKDVPRYPTRDQVVQYLIDYADHFQLQPRFNEVVTRVARVDNEWIVETVQNRFRAACVVIASGYNRTPYMPEWPGQNEYRGYIMHSSEYRNGAGYKGQRVLVVGFGNTGGEIALDLCEHGAEPTVCVRGPVNVVPRDFMGTPMQVSGIMLNRLPRPLANAIQKSILRVAVGDLSRYGIERPAISPADHVDVFGRVPLIDVGTIQCIKDGKIGVIPAIKRFTPTGVTCVDDSQYPFDSVVLATGYRPGLADFLECAEDVTDERGYPVPPAGESKVPGLYFMGYCNPSTGFLRQINIDAQRVAREIAGHVAGE